jgi:hypothetical protein
MTDEPTILVSALVDGEPVDADAIAAALEIPEARAALVDFLRMRTVVRAGDPPLPGSLHRLRRPPHALRVLPWPAVAALLVLVFLAGLAAPRPWQPPNRDSDPPAPTRVERFTPGVDWHSSN